MLLAEGHMAAFEDFFFESIANPDADNPYILNGCDCTPPAVSRAMFTYEDVVAVLHEAMTIHGLGRADILAAVSIKPGRIDEILLTGRGSVTEYFELFEAVGVDPVTIPYSAC